MNKSQRTVLIIFLLVPVTTFAHGEQVLIPFVIDFVNLAIFLFAILTIRLTLTGKTILTVIYVMAIGTITYWFMIYVEYLDYIESMGFTNLIIFTVPWTVYLITYLGLRTKFKRTT